MADDRQSVPSYVAVERVQLVRTPAVSVLPTPSPDDPRFLHALALFNRREFFACHDALEELWGETLGTERQFYQGLLHATVALYHFGEGNLGGARKMYVSAVRYLRPYRPERLGVDVDALLAGLEDCFAELLAASGAYPAGLTLEEERVPLIAPARTGQSSVRPSLSHAEGSPA